MKIVNRFTRDNKIISTFFIVSIIIMASYLCTTDWPELFSGAGEIYNLFYQLSIGYIINFVFYITQVYIPSSKKESVTKRCIAQKIEQLIKDMDGGLVELVKIYVKNCPENQYEEKDLEFLHKLKFLDKVQVVKASSIRGGNADYFTVREWLMHSITTTEKDIDNLYKYYGTNLSADLMETLEKILRSTYHVIFKTLLEIPEELFLTKNMK